MNNLNKLILVTVMGITIGPGMSYGTAENNGPIRPEEYPILDKAFEDVTVSTPGGKLYEEKAAFLLRRFGLDLKGLDDDKKKIALRICQLKYDLADGSEADREIDAALLAVFGARATGNLDADTETKIDSLLQRFGLTPKDFATVEEKMEIMQLCQKIYDYEWEDE